MDRSTAIALVSAAVVVSGVLGALAAYVKRSSPPEVQLGQYHAGGQVPIATEAVRMGVEQRAVREMYCFPYASSVAPFRALLLSGRSHEAAQFALERQMVRIPVGGKFTINAVDVETASIEVKARTCYVARADVSKE